MEYPICYGASVNLFITLPAAESLYMVYTSVYYIVQISYIVHNIFTYTRDTFTYNRISRSIDIEY